MSGAFFAVYFFVAARSLRQKRVDPRAWFLIGMLITSTTITNVVPFAIGLFIVFVHLREDFSQALRRTARIVSGAVAATYMAFLLLTAIHGTFKGIGRRVSQLEEVGFHPRSMFLNFPKAIAHSIVPVHPNELTGTDEEGKSQEIKVVRFTFRDDLESIQRGVPTVVAYRQFYVGSAFEFGVLAVIAVAILLSSQVLGKAPRTPDATLSDSFQSPTSSRSVDVALAASPIGVLFLISIAQITFNWVLHSFFGNEVFLYSQHWIIPLVVAITSGVTLRRPKNWPELALVLVLIATATVQDISVVRSLLAD
jgi:hypothetical protein